MRKVSRVLSIFFIPFCAYTCSTPRPLTSFTYIYWIETASSFVQVLTLNVTSFSARNSDGEEVRIPIVWPPAGTIPFNLGQMEVGSYSDVKMTISGGTVTVGNVVYTLQIPDPVAQISGTFTIYAKHNNYVNVTFNVDASVIPDGQGGYLLRPSMTISRLGPIPNPLGGI